MLPEAKQEKIITFCVLDNMIEWLQINLSYSHEPNEASVLRQADAQFVKY